MFILTRSKQRHSECFFVTNMYLHVYIYIYFRLTFLFIIEYNKWTVLKVLGWGSSVRVCGGGGGEQLMPSACGPNLH